MIHWRRSYFPCFYQLLIQDTETSCYKGWYLLYKRRKAPSVHTLLFFLPIPASIAFDRLVICIFLNHNSFSAILLYYGTFYTLVHGKHCCILTILFFAEIIHSRGAVWASLGTVWWITEVPGGHGNKERGRGEEAGLEEMETGAKTKTIITWGDKEETTAWENMANLEEEIDMNITDLYTIARNDFGLKVFLSHLIGYV